MSGHVVAVNRKVVVTEVCYVAQRIGLVGQVTVLVRGIGGDVACAARLLKPGDGEVAVPGQNRGLLERIGNRRDLAVAVVGIGRDSGLPTWSRWRHRSDAVRVVPREGCCVAGAVNEVPDFPPVEVAARRAVVIEASLRPRRIDDTVGIADAVDAGRLGRGLRIWV